MALALGLTGALAGCGSQTKTVTVASTPGASAGTTQTTTTQTTPTTHTAPTSPAPGQGGGGTAAPTTTRTAPEPAFTEHETRAEGLAGATAAVRARGYTPNDTSEYHSGQTLRVLVGTRTGSAEFKGQQAFFFVGERFIGTDAKQASASVKVLSQGDTEVTLSYPLYHPGDPFCCPGGGQATVHFQLNNGRLTALDPIPPASSSSGLSRY